MGIESLAKTKARRVIGLDCSTKSLAFAVFEDGKPVACGEVTFEGSTVMDRLDDAGDKAKALVDSGVLVGDYVALESAVFVNNIQTAIDLAYVYGAILRELMVLNPIVTKKAPLEWQTAIGNPPLTKVEKEQIRNDTPGKSDNWYKSRGREIRKHRTLDIAKRYFDIPGDSDNVGDAVGIALSVLRDDIR
jgi:Holliday junction resolvasome RuvABC endonuclease subunit